MALVTIDTQILIWGGIRSDAEDSEGPPAEMVRRARILLHQLERDGHELVIPAVIASELAIPIAAEKHAAFLAALQDRFYMPPFDLPAAAVAAQLYQKFKKAKLTLDSPRQVLSADIKIIATAYRAGVRLFYSHDSDARKIAKLQSMGAKDLPQDSDELFDEAPLPREGKKSTKRKGRLSGRANRSVHL